MRLPHNQRDGGYVALRMTQHKLHIVVRRQVRHWWFWKRWRNDVLATKDYTIKAGDVATLTQVGRIFTVRINDNPVLRFPK